MTVSDAFFFLDFLRVKSCNHVLSGLRIFMNFWKPFYEYKNAVLNDEKEKGSINSVRVG